jgi:hypothetical protein
MEEIIPPYQFRVNLLILTSEAKYGKLSMTIKVREGWRETEKPINRRPQVFWCTAD